MARFGSVNLKIRPIKIAFLVDSNNAKQVREAIQLSSTLWGGAYCPIVPLYKQMPKTWREGLIKAPKAKRVVLGYIEAFDPDVLVQLSKDVPTYLKDLKLEIIKPDDIWKITDEERSLSPRYGIGVFEILNDLFDKHFKYKAKYPVKIVIPKLPKQYSLFWVSLFGEIPQNLMPTIKEHYSEPLEITEPKFKPEDVGEVLKSNVIFPRRMAQHALDHISRSGPRRSAYAYFMDASKVEDIVDFWNLRAMGRSVVPIPKQFLSNKQLREIIIGFFKDHRRHWKHNKTVCDYTSIVRSRNSTMEELQEYAKTLVLKPEPNDPSKDGFFSLQHWYPRLWDEWARDKDGAIPDDFFGDEDSIEIGESAGLKASFRPLLPKFAGKHVYHGEPRCVNEVSFRLYGSDEYLAGVFPKSSGENFIRSISSFGSFRDTWRVGRHGLVKLVKDTYTENWDIPESQKVVFAWLKDQGWDAELSSAGLLAKQMYRKLDGHALTLANEKLLGLLEHMNGGSVQTNGQPMTNNRINQERELQIGEIRSKLQDQARRSDLCNYLILKGVFHVGVRIQCPHCVRNSWFPVEKIDKAFTCPKCLNTFPAIGNIENGQWCYKTSGPFSVPGYADGAYATLLALEFFNDHKLNTLLATPVLSFTAKSPNKKDIEADYALFWQDSIYGEKKDGLLFGESKTYGQFQKKDFNRMSYLAKNFPGAVIVFSTLRKTLTSAEIKGITKIAKAGRKFWKSERPINPVLILTGNELFSFHGPPYCWEDAGIKEKFNHLRGLISICDATQQIYLKLPSWETEWREKWEKLHKKRLAAKNKIVEEKKPE
ncbi:MAG: hypothetical protein AAB518_02970 [Patescibacteria group bacterium]